MATNMTALESRIQYRVKKELKKHFDCIVHKYVTHRVGDPDLIIHCKNNFTFFIEVKKDSDSTISEHQKKRVRDWTKLGFPVFIISGDQDLQGFCNYMVDVLKNNWGYEVVKNDTINMCPKCLNHNNVKDNPFGLCDECRKDFDRDFEATAILDVKGHGVCKK